MRVVSESGELLNANVSLATIDGDFGLVFESRGGARGRKNERNTEYTNAVVAVLDRLKRRGVKSVRAYLASAVALSKWSKAERLLVIDGKDQIDLTAVAPLDLQRRLGRALQSLKGDPATKGGNSTKRVMLVADLGSDDWNSIVLGGKVAVIPSDTEIDEVTDAFDPAGMDESKERALRALALRRGQPTFRRKLLSAYADRCAITQSSVVAILEAAHIVPFQGESTNHVTNGILLRSDIHTLFDMGLLGIDQAYRVLVDHSLAGTEYERYQGQLLALPAQVSERPSLKALASRPLPKPW